MSINIHLVAANARGAVTFTLSTGQAANAPCGLELLRAWGATGKRRALFLDRAYEGDKTHQLARILGFLPTVPTNPNRLRP